ncbi:MAG: hypothetical protein K6G40_01740 [Eubacterium sp.]|nr:hypothetical protein [Eubacterium sp.]
MRILFYGDSNTYGYDPRGPIPGRYKEEKTWPYLVGTKIKDGEVFAEGLNGREIPSEEFDFEVLFNAVKRYSPIDYIGIMLGSNDYLNMFTPSVDEVTNKMEKALIRLEREFPNLKILLIAPPPIKTANVCGMRKYDTEDGSLSRAYKKLAEKKNILFFDAAAEPLSLAFDGVHLAEEGHGQLAKRLADYFNTF